MEKKNEKEIIIKIEGTEWEGLMDEAFKKANKKAKIAGFRPGKAPKNVYIKHYGKESLYRKGNKLLQEYWRSRMFNGDIRLESRRKNPHYRRNYRCV